MPGKSTSFDPCRHSGLKVKMNGEWGSALPVFSPTYCFTIFRTLQPFSIFHVYRYNKRFVYKIQVSIINTHAQYKHPLESIDHIMRGCIAKDISFRRLFMKVIKQLPLKGTGVGSLPILSAGVQLGVSFPLIKKPHK
jgi:hypothetical protein